MSKPKTYGNPAAVRHGSVYKVDPDKISAVNTGSDEEANKAYIPLLKELAQVQWRDKKLNTTREERDGLVADRLNKQKYTLKKLAEDANTFEDRLAAVERGDQRVGELKSLELVRMLRADLEAPNPSDPHRISIRRRELRILLDDIDRLAGVPHG